MLDSLKPNDVNLIALAYVSATNLVTARGFGCRISDTYVASAEE